MRATTAIASLFAAGFVLASAGDAWAANFSLWIHGRSPGGSQQPGNYSDFSYWGPSTTAAGVNKRGVNWDGKSRIADQNFRIRDALDCFCTGSNWCYIAAHSAGDAQIGYALAMFGGSTRNVKTPGAGSNGVCTNAGGTQTGWNIKWVRIASGGGGGSELANMGDWAVSDPLTSDLKTATMRALYDHNQTRSKTFFMFAGAKGTLYSGTLPGQDDEALAYHSTGAVASTGSFCNSGDWFCDGSLTTGTGATSNSKAKWSFHSVKVIDTSEQYNHYANGTWSGIIAPVRSEMVSLAL